MTPDERPAVPDPRGNSMDPARPVRPNGGEIGHLIVEAVAAERGEFGITLEVTPAAHSSSFSL
jgi:hypothetical protein